MQVAQVRKFGMLSLLVRVATTRGTCCEWIIYQVGKWALHSVLKWYNWTICVALKAWRCFYHIDIGTPEEYPLISSLRLILCDCSGTSAENQSPLLVHFCQNAVHWLNVWRIHGPWTFVSALTFLSLNYVVCHGIVKNDIRSKLYMSVHLCIFTQYLFCYILVFKHEQVISSARWAGTCCFQLSHMQFLRLQQETTKLHVSRQSCLVESKETFLVILVRISQLNTTDDTSAAYQSRHQVSTSTETLFAEDSEQDFHPYPLDWKPFQLFTHFIPLLHEVLLETHVLGFTHVT